MRRQSFRRRALAVAAGLLAVAIAATGCTGPTIDSAHDPVDVQGTLDEATVTQMTDAVTSALGATGAPGAIVGVWVPWSGAWVAGIGTTTPGGAAVDDDMSFRAGKVTRAMTCDVLYQQAAAGNVSLSDPITKWVSGVSGMEEITLESLCDGTSGIGASTPSLWGQWISNPSRRWSPLELASYGLGQARTVQPGTSYVDSDAGYVLLGLALERASGESAANLISDEVAGPLGLDATSLDDLSDAASALPGLNSPGVSDGLVDCVTPTDVTALSSTAGFTDGGVVTDINDLGRYAQALAAGTLSVDEKRFAAPVPYSASAPSWQTVDGGAVQAGSLIGQFGAVPGYITAAFADPNTGLTVAVVLNNSAAGGEVGAQLAFELAAIASKVAAGEGKTAPESGLPWTAQQYHDAIAARQICAPAA